MENIYKISNLYVATLKAIAFIHQHNHWTTNGIAFYSSHLLFQRIYDSALKNLDMAGEKCVGVLGQNSIDYEMQVELLSKVLDKYISISDLTERSLKIEKDFLTLSSEFYKILENTEKLTLGMDDMIMSIANDREEACYLLQQSK